MKGEEVVVKGHINTPDFIFPIHILNIIDLEVHS